MGMDLGVGSGLGLNSLGGLCSRGSGFLGRHGER